MDNRRCMVVIRKNKKKMHGTSDRLFSLLNSQDIYESVYSFVNASVYLGDKKKFFSNVQ